MSEPVTLVRPDGSTIQVSPEDAKKLIGLGYQEESESSQLNRNITEAKEEYYSTTGQKAKTAVEGGLSGLTLGLSDHWAMAASGGEAGERAKHNPGYRLGGEIVGALVTAIPSGGSSLAVTGAKGASTVGKVLAKTPAGLATRAGEAAASGLVGRGKRAAVGAAVEGAAFGAGAEVANSALSGDPLTAESVIAGMGWGALYGGALGGVVGTAAGALESRAARRAVDELSTDAAVATSKLIPDEHYSMFRSSVGDARKAADDAVVVARQSVDGTTNVHPIEDVTPVMQSAKEAQGTFLNEVSAQGKMGEIGARQARDEVLASYKKVTAAAAEGTVDGYKGFEKALAEHQEKMATLSRVTGIAAPDAMVFERAAEKASMKAIEEVKSLSAIGDALSKFPVTPAGFAATTASKMERHVAAVEALMGTSSAELAGVRMGLTKSIEDMATSMGVKVDGGPAVQLRAMHEMAREAKTVGGAEARAAGLGGRLFGVGAGAAAASVGGTAARKAGLGAIGGAVGRAAARHVVSGMIGIRGVVTGALSSAVNSWAPKALRAAEAVHAPARFDPLRTRLDGTVDEEKTRKQLMAARAQEVRDAAATMNDNLYKALEPLSGAHPEFASEMHRLGVDQFSKMTAHLPRDPGNAYSRLKSLWTPDPVAIEKFARKWEVFHNPIGVVKRALETGKVTPEAAGALAEYNPQLFAVMRAGMLARLQEPGNLEKLSYQEQISLGSLLKVTIHSTHDPKFIMAQQDMYRERNEPLTVRPPGGSTSNNPSGGRPSDSPAQNITNH